MKMAIFLSSYVACLNVHRIAYVKTKANIFDNVNTLNSKRI